MLFLNFLVLILLALFFVVFTFFSLFKSYGRFSVCLTQLTSTLRELVVNKVTLFILFYTLLIVNVVGNLPAHRVPTLFYSETITISLLFWIPLAVCIFIYDFKGFISHMLPYGAPTALILFLPIIEIFSQLIRPFTLMVRLRTNLSRGHIIIYMFSYFTLLNSYLAPFIGVVISLLLILELFISALQAYIFVSLLVLYIQETD